MEDEGLKRVGNALEITELLAKMDDRKMRLVYEFCKGLTGKE